MVPLQNPLTRQAGRSRARTDGDVMMRHLSPRLARALASLAGVVRHDPDMSLADLRLALLATAYVWSPDGRLALAGECAERLAEFDRLIERYGADARAADLLP